MGAILSEISRSIPPAAGIAPVPQFLGQKAAGIFATVLASAQNADNGVGVSAAVVCGQSTFQAGLATGTMPGPNLPIFQKKLDNNFSAMPAGQPFPIQSLVPNPVVANPAPLISSLSMNLAATTNLSSSGTAQVERVSVANVAVNDSLPVRISANNRPVDASLSGTTVVAASGIGISLASASGNLAAPQEMAPTKQNEWANVLPASARTVSSLARGNESQESDAIAAAVPLANTPAMAPVNIGTGVIAIAPPLSASDLTDSRVLLANAQPSDESANVRWPIVNSQSEPGGSVTSGGTVLAPPDPASVTSSVPAAEASSVRVASEIANPQLVALFMPVTGNAKTPSASRNAGPASSGIAVPSGTERVTGRGVTLAPIVAAPRSDAGTVENSTIAAQTPFSVFFGGPGPAEESAVGLLPKMILPQNAAGVANNPSNVAGTALQPASTKNSTARGIVTGTPNNKSTTAAVEETTTAGTPAIAIPSTPQSIAERVVVASPAAAIPQSPSSAATGAVAQAAVSPETLTKTGLPSTNTTNVASPPSSFSAEMPATPPASPVQMAQMVSQATQSEMRIGMSTTAFGSVEVRTVVHANEVGLVIGSEKGDLRALLANEIPAIASTLQLQNLRLNSVSYMQGFAFSNNSPGGGGDSQPRSFTPNRSQSYSPVEGLAEDTVESKPMASWARGSGSLSILA